MFVKYVNCFKVSAKRHYYTENVFGYRKKTPEVYRGDV